MSMLRQDFRYGLRLLARSPSFTAVAVLTLALGIGANTAIFSVMNALLLHPPGLPDPNRVVALRVKYDKLNLKSIVVSAPDFVDVRESKQIFSAAAMADEADFNYTGSDLPERLLGAPVTWQWFEVFGAKPRLGRAFQPEEDQPGANRIAILSDATWKRLFGSDPAILGETIQLNQLAYKVVGVMGPEFNWPPQAQLWVPLGLPAADYAADNRFNESYFAVARIRPDVTLKQAQAFLPVLNRRAEDSNTRVGAYVRDSAWGMFILPLTEFAYGDLKTPLYILLGSVAFVLLIACSNIAGLMLARGSARARELAVRSALGASRWDLIRQTLAESFVLAGAGTLLGLLFAAIGIRALLWLAPESIAQGLVIHPDANVLLFTALIGIVAGGFFGLIPAWQVSRSQEFVLLKEGSRSGTAGRGRQRMRSALVIGEVALALVLLVGAGLFLRSLAHLQRVGPGFDPHGVMTAALSLPESQYKELEKRLAFYQALVERMSAIPGVSAAAEAAPLPFTGSGASASFSIDGRPEGPGDPGPHSDLRWISPGYFAAMKILLLKGRYFNDQDRRGGQPVIVIDENLAKQYWPNQDPIGQRVRRGTEGPWATIVGVVGHVMHSALTGDSGKGVCYYPTFQRPVPNTFLVLKTSGDAAALAGPIREAVRAIDPAQPVSNLKTMDENLAGSLAPRRFAVTLLGFFAGVALLMAALGLYGVINYSVSLRTQEIGIRMALGAQTSQVLGMVVGQGMRLAGFGSALGLLGAWLLARLLTSQLFEVGAFDPIVFLVMASALALVAALATYIPARRAARVDPMVALRYE
jgi:predicted permease